MQHTVIAHLQQLFAAHADLSHLLPSEAFAKKLPVRSNSIGGQWWCVIGARESYLQALQQGQWVGFHCSLAYDRAQQKQRVVEALDRTARGLLITLEGLALADVRQDLLVDLLEHEALHPGQLIRYVYGLGYSFPKSWAERWALTD